MINFSDSVFTGGKIRIDNIHYKGCTFDGCVIEYGGEGPILLEGCNFNNCSWALVGAAKHTIQFLTTMQNEFGDFGKGMVKFIFEGITDPKNRENSVKLPDHEF
jgi:hypothetical protein